MEADAQDKYGSSIENLGLEKVSLHDAGQLLMSHTTGVYSIGRWTLQLRSKLCRGS